MLLTFLLALAAVAGGWLLSYSYLPRVAPVVRFFIAACTGLVLLGCVGFVLASLLGMTILTLLLAGVAAAIPLLLLIRSQRRAAVRTRLLGERSRYGLISLSAAGIALALLIVFSFVMYERGGEIFTGFDNNIGDLPFHLSIITGFARGDNFPPEHTEYAGVRLTYPFLVDFIAALFTRAGATLAQALLIENVLLAWAFVGVLYLWARELTGSVAAARLSVPLVLLSGGFGWWMFLLDANAEGLFETLAALPRNYTITSTGGYRWGNTLTVLLVPQRSLLLGATLFLLASTLLWRVLRGAESGGSEDSWQREDAAREIRAVSKSLKRNNKKAQRRAETRKTNPEKTNPKQARDDESTAIKSKVEGQGFNFFADDLPDSTLSTRQMLAAGIIAGFLPLAHAHGFALLMAIAVVLAMLFWRSVSPRVWAAFFVPALVLAVPQIVWVTHESPVRARDFIAWEFGWDHGAENPVWFWLKNAGAFLLPLVLALVWRRGMISRLTGREAKDEARAPLIEQKLLLFYVPFACVFVGANVLRLSPWIWDNIKVLFLWFIASAPLVALLLVDLWRSRNHLARVAVVCLVFLLTAAGALDVVRVVTGAAEQRSFSREDVSFAGVLEREVAPKARVLHAPVYNHPVLLTGRRSIMGYPGHLWTHGISYLPREQDIKAVYAGANRATEFLQREQVEYIVVGPHERASLAINEAALRSYTLVADTGAYRLYRVSKK